MDTAAATQAEGTVSFSRELPLELMEDALKLAAAGEPGAAFDSLLPHLVPWGISAGELVAVDGNAHTRIAGMDVGPDAHKLPLHDGYGEVGEIRIELTGPPPVELLEVLRHLFSLGLGQRTRVWELELVRAAVAVNAAESFDAALEDLAERCCRLVGAPSANIAVWEPDFSSATIRAAAGLARPLVGERVGDGSVSHQATQKREPILHTPDKPQEGISDRLKEETGRYALTLSVPLMLDGVPRITFQADWLEKPAPETIALAISAIEKLDAVTNIAFRAEREREQLAHYELLEVVVETVPDGIIVQRGDEVKLNTAARRLLGLTPTQAAHDLANLNVRRIDGTVADPSEYPSRLCRTLGHETSARLIASVGGEDRIFEFKAAPLVDGFVGLVRDVTEEHGEQVLTKHFLESLFESLPLAAGVANLATGEMQSVNRAFIELIGYDEDEILGARRPYPWWGPEFRGDHWDDPAGTIETVFRRKDGSPVPVELLPFHVRDADGVPARIVALIRDTSERHDFERQILQSGKLAAIGELASGVAHEINNPLFAILGLVEFLIRDAEAGTKTHERLTLIQQTGLEIKQIVKALLDFARERTDEHGPMMLREVVAETVELVRRTSAGKSLEIVERYTGEPTPILGSPNQIKQIVLNLISNAQHAMGENAGTLTLCVEPEGTSVILVVSDTGPGIPSDIISRIFEPFFTTKRDLGGTGLGLAVSHGIAAMHGGELTVDSEPGRGATFRLRLPRALAPRA
jgi:PAS domain S-box-containing protein